MTDVNPDPNGLNGGAGYTGGTWQFYFYGITGQKLVTLTCTYNYGYPSCGAGSNLYFGGKLIQSPNGLVVTDRLGSVRATSGCCTWTQMSYFPYGEERTSTAEGTEKFGTYFSDAVGQDYAQQRYYNNGTGRFWNVDPGGVKTARPGNPGSWNRYAYVLGDPINKFDPTGEEDVDDGGGDFGCCDDDYGASGGGGGDGGDEIVYNVGATFSTTVTDDSGNADGSGDDTGGNDTDLDPLTTSTSGFPCLQDATPAQGQKIINNASGFLGTPYKTPATPNGLVCTGLVCRAVRPLSPGFPEGPASGWLSHPGLRPLRPKEPRQVGDVIIFPGHVGLFDPGT